MKRNGMHGNSIPIIHGSFFLKCAPWCGTEERSEALFGTKSVEVRSMSKVYLKHWCRILVKMEVEVDTLRLLTEPE